MATKNKNRLAGTIPEQFVGKQLDCSKTVELSSVEQAEQHYQVVSERLLNVNRWHQYTQVPSAEFRIVDHLNQFLERPVEQGDTIRIDIPGPGLPSAQGYDWVQVEKIRRDDRGSEKQIAL